MRFPANVQHALACAVLIFTASACASHYRPPEGTDAELATVSGDDGPTALWRIDGVSVGALIGGTHKLVPGQHTLLFAVDRGPGATSAPIPFDLFARIVHCRVDLDAQPGHHYVYKTVMRDIGGVEVGRFHLIETTGSGEVRNELMATMCR